MRQVAERDLHDVCGDCGCGLTRIKRQIGLLARCDGTRTADAIGNRPLLEELAGRDWVQWGFDLAIEARPLEHLRAQVEALPARARRTTLKAVQSLERSRIAPRVPLADNPASGLTTPISKQIHAAPPTQWHNQAHCIRQCPGAARHPDPHD